MFPTFPRSCQPALACNVIAGDRLAHPVPDAGSPHSHEAEVEHFGDALGRHLDVGRLDVAMDGAFFARGLERVDELARVVASHPRRRRDLLSASYVSNPDGVVALVP
jgi:hypothetical protein